MIVLMSSPLARDRGLWSRVIIESQPYTIAIRDPTTMPALMKEFGRFVGCDMNDRTCLMKMNSSAILKAQESAQGSFASDPK
jgi:carboxylesterase type B